MNYKIGQKLDEWSYKVEQKNLITWSSVLKDPNPIHLDNKTVKKLGPNHNPFFQVNVQIQNSKKFHGEGNSKKNAQQNAALKLITNLNI